MRRHQHLWTTIARKFADSGVTSIKMQRADQEAIDRAMYGITTINQECSGCGLGRAYTVAGDAT